MYYKILLTNLLFLTSQILFSQVDSLRIAKFDALPKNNSIQFTPKLPPLQQIAGAPKSFYSYFWEFGDGKYSTTPNPKHTYTKKGKYKVRLWATNNYGIERPPATRPSEVINEQASIESEEEFPITNDLELIRNHEPIPGEEMLFVVRYQNSKSYTSSGKIYLFFNELKYKDPNFKMKEGRFYNDEQWAENNDISYTFKKNNSYSEIASSENILVEQIQINDSINKTDLPVTIQKAKEKYRDFKTIKFDNMNSGEKRNLFFTLYTPPEMIKDTSAIISIRSIYVPDENYDNHKVKDMEMEIVTSHDPNKMSTSNTFINYRIARFKRIKYKIKFQNNGEGPARTIRLETDIPDMYDKSTIKVEKNYPECPICPKNKKVRYSCLDTTYTNKQAIFTFKNIYLPGSEQKNVKEYDSTKGFVKYSLKFKKDFKKKKTKSRTAIIFDKNDPIITNYSTTRFVPGISIEAKAGYNYYPNLNNSKSLFFGVAISPYKSYRFYLQAELLNNFTFFDKETDFKENTLISTQEFEVPITVTPQDPNNPRDPDNPQNPDIPRTETVIREIRMPQEIISDVKITRYTVGIPMLLRYNINNYIGIGSGIQADIILNENREIIQTTRTFLNEEKLELESEKTESFEETRTLNEITPSLLLDLTLGFARIGPSLGVRYINTFDKKNSFWQLYARWKF